eukprot:gene2095-18153_t
MRGAFMSVTKLVQQRDPNMEVVGSPYPVAWYRVAASQALLAAQIGALIIIVMGENIFAMLGMPRPPDWYVEKVQNQKFGMAMGVWFVGNYLCNAIVQTGAFEVFYDGELASTSQHAAIFRPYCQAGRLHSRRLSARLDAFTDAGLVPGRTPSRTPPGLSARPDAITAAGFH